MTKNANEPKSALPDLKKKKPARGLGRGLDALLGDRPSGQSSAPNKAGKSFAKTTGDREVAITQIKPNPKQPRTIFDKAAITELTMSVRERGILQPILVRPLPSDNGEIQYEIVAGERRWRAAQLAGLHKVPVVIRELSDAQASEIALIENVQRVDLNPMEEAEGYHFLAKQYGRSQDSIAKAVGKSRSHVANLMRLTSLPPAVRDALTSNEISMGHARALLSSPDSAGDLKEVLRSGLSVRQLEARIKAHHQAENKSQPSSKAAKGSAQKDADTRALERDLAEALGLEVSIAHKKSGSGNVTVSYLNLDQLDDICRRLMDSKV